MVLHKGVAVYKLFYKLVWLLLLFGWRVMLFRFLSIISELMKFFSCSAMITHSQHASSPAAVQG